MYLFIYIMKAHYDNKCKFGSYDKFYMIISESIIKLKQMNVLQTPMHLIEQSVFI